jgi:uncharacterized protein
VTDERQVRAFLKGTRFALIDASDDAKTFGNTVFKELVGHGYEVVPVNPNVPSVDGTATYATIGEVPGDLDGAIVMVGAPRSAGIVSECADRGVRRVWLFKGLGGPGAYCEEAVAVADERKVDVIAGACPLMFLEPVGWFHRAHRTMRHLNGSLRKAA